MAMHYVSGSWSNIGSAVSTGHCSYVKMGMDNAGNPVIGYVDSTNANNITVKRYTGAAWSDLAMPAISTNQFSLAADRNNIIYVCAGNSSGVFNIYTYNAGAWTTTSNIATTSTLPAYTAMAMDTVTNTPYIVYADNNTQLTVRKLNGASWPVVGSAGFTSGAYGCYYPDIKITKNSVPVVATQEDNGPERLSCYKFSGGSWSPVGPKSFSGTHSYFTSLTLDDDNTPFVAFYDVAYAGLSVRGYSPTMNIWDTVGPRGVKPIRSGYVLSATCNKHSAFVAFADETVGGKMSMMEINTLCYNNNATWTGDTNNTWENPSNWACGTTPQPTSNVVIPAGATVTVNANATINSVNVQPGAAVTVGAGVTFNVLHP